MPYQKVACIVVVLIALVPARHSRAYSIVVNPIADTFVSANLANNNYGLGGASELSAPGSANGEYQSLLKFDLSNFGGTFDSIFGPGGWTLQTVRLRLTSTPPNNVIFNNNVAGTVAASWIQNDSWIEGTGIPQAPTSDGVTWNTLSGYLGPQDQSMGTFAYPGGSSGVNTYTLTPGTGFQNDLAAGGTVTIRLAGGDSTISYLYNTRNFSTASARPLLIVSAIPEPGVTFTGAAAVLGLFARGHRRLQ